MTITLDHMASELDAADSPDRRAGLLHRLLADTLTRLGDPATPDALRPSHPPCDPVSVTAVADLTALLASRCGDEEAVRAGAEAAWLCRRVASGRHGRGPRAQELLRAAARHLDRMRDLEHSPRLF